MKLERGQIVDMALQLLNELGLDQLSTRKLADRLNVQQPALYWHFKNKRALLDAMNDEMLKRGHIHINPLLGEDWRMFLYNNAHSFRRSLLAYRDGARVHAGTEAAPGDLERFDWQLGFFSEAGFSVDLALHTIFSVSRFTVGCVLEEQADFPEDAENRGAKLDEAASRYPLLSQAMALYRAGGHAATFEAGLTLLLDGAQARLLRPER